MTAQWVKYDGSDDQLLEIMHSAHGYLYRNNNGYESNILTACGSLINLANELNDDSVTEYLICSPHPYADMICQWARTGQPVYWRSITGGGTGLCHENFPPFMHPVEFEYSFTPFEDEVNK